MAEPRTQGNDAAALERALVDLLRVGLSGDAPGLRQLGRRLIRKAPSGVGDVPAFRQAIGEVLNAAPATGVSFRSTTDIPADIESRMPLLRINDHPSRRPPVLSPDASERLEGVVRERQMASTLTDAGLQPVRSVLLSGPPGVGKTMTAEYLAARLDLPLVTVDLASLMSSFLGKTGQNLRAALTYGQSAQCVFLLDEFDALAKRRDDEADVGELKRLVNVLLLELDRWPATSLLVAATNLPELLDRSVNRRFVVLLSLTLPGSTEREEILRGFLEGVQDDELVSEAVLQVCSRLTDGLSASELVRLTSQATRGALVNGGSIASGLLKASVVASPKPILQSGAHRDAFCGLARTLLGYSDRQTASLLGISHPTVAKAVARWNLGDTVLKASTPEDEEMAR